MIFTYHIREYSWSPDSLEWLDAMFYRSIIGLSGLIVVSPHRVYYVAPNPWNGLCPHDCTHVPTFMRFRAVRTRASGVLAAESPSYRTLFE